MILVTGGTGRIGRKLLVELLARGEKVRAIVRNEERAIYLPKGAEPFYADITKKETLLNAFKDVEKVVHLAASVEYGGDKELLQKVNVEGTRNLLEACPSGIKKFVYVSSISVYGYRLAKVPADEETQCTPSTAYGKSKLDAEKEVLAFAGKMPVAIVRPGLVYGEGFNEGYVPVLEALEKGKLPLLGNGENRLPFVHVDDVIAAIALAVEKDVKSGSTYNIVGEQLTQKEVFALACIGMGVKPPRNGVPVALAKLIIFGKAFVAGIAGKKPALIIEYVDKLASNRQFNTAKAESELGFRAKVKLADGIKEMVKYYGTDKGGKASAQGS